MKSNNEIFQETLGILQAGGYTDSGGTWHDIMSSKPGSILYQTLSTLKEHPSYDSTVIKWEKKDILAVTKELKGNVLVLNPADPTVPPIDCEGNTVEEILLRRTNLSQSLYSFSENTFEIFGNRKPKTYKYPIKTYGGIYTPNVTVFRATGLLRRPFSCSVASIPPLIVSSNKLKNGEKLIIKGKIRSLFRIAIKFGHDKIVLPDIFPKDLFEEVIKEREFNQSFKTICIILT